MKKKIYSYIFILISSLVMLYFLGLLYFVSLVPIKPAISTSKSDAIVVLTGGDKRIEKGFILLKNNKANKLFITGVNDKIKLSNISQIEKFQSILDFDYKSKVYLGINAQNTQGNALETKQWISEAENIKSIILVTANYHMPRSLLEFHKALPYIKIIPYPVFPEGFKIHSWWKHKSSSLLLMNEYKKYIFIMITNLYK